MRVDLFDIEIESLRHFSTFTQRSLGDLDEVEIAPAAELAAEHRELAEIAAIAGEDERPDVAELLPVDRFHALLDLIPAERGDPARGRGGDRAGARRPLAGRLRGDPRRRRAPPLRRRPSRSRPRSTRAPASGSRRCPSDQPLEFRAQAADVGARSLKEAEPVLEQHVRSAYRTVVTYARRGEGERAAYNLARLQRAVARRRPRAARRSSRARARCASPRPRCARASSPPACSSP